MLSLGLERGLPLSCCVNNLGNDCKGPRSIARVLYAGEVRQGLLEVLGHQSLLSLYAGVPYLAMHHSARTLPYKAAVQFAS